MPEIIFWGQKLKVVSVLAKGCVEFMMSASTHIQNASHVYIKKSVLELKRKITSIYYEILSTGTDGCSRLSCSYNL